MLQHSSRQTGISLFLFLWSRQFINHRIQELIHEIFVIYVVNQKHFLSSVIGCFILSVRHHLFGRFRWLYKKSIIIDSTDNLPLIIDDVFPIIALYDISSSDDSWSKMNFKYSLLEAIENILLDKLDFILYSLIHSDFIKGTSIIKYKCIRKSSPFFKTHFFIETLSSFII